MFRSVKQVRAAVSMVNPEAVRALADRTVQVGLVAGTSEAYAEMEDFLIPSSVPHIERMHSAENVYRAGELGIPDHVDLVLYEHGLPCPQGAFSFRRDDPESTIAEILHENDELALPLARQFPGFRQPVVQNIVHAVSAENALFAVASALPNVVPNLFELPWAVGEFASDTAFLTINQVRMAFLIAAACGKEVGFLQQKAELIMIAGGAFGWRALARELAGKIPLGGGLIPKGAIAYAGTFIIGKGLEHYHHAGVPLSKAQRDEVYQQAYEQGKTVAASAARLPAPNQ